jgi:DNA-binding NtrC family response regulator
VRPADLPRSLKPARRPPAVEPGRSGAKLELSLDEPLDASVRRILLAVLEAEGGNRSRAAKRLGVSLRTVQRHLARMTP